MSDFKSIKEKLDNLYNIYIEKNHKLSMEKSNSAALLIAKMSSCPECDVKKVAEELIRFPESVNISFFTKLTQTMKNDISVIDEILTALVDYKGKEKNKAFSRIKKYSSIVTAVVNSSKVSFKSSVLPTMVLSVAKYMIKDEKYTESFRSFINKTNGSIYLLDYNECKEGIQQLYCITKKVYPDLNKSKYSEIIKEWADKYGLETKETTHSEEVSNKKSDDREAIIIKEEKTEPPVKQEISKDNNSEIITFIRDENKQIMLTLEQNILPLKNAVDSFQAQFVKSVETAEENIRLKLQVERLNGELAEEKNNTQNLRQAYEELKSEKESLESKAEQLDMNLKEAYNLNSREASLEVERLKASIKKSMKLCYENWNEFNSEEYSPENYESLHAIIKSIFRGLSKNGIEVKEND